MEKLAKCIKHNESFNITEGMIYKLSTPKDDFKTEYTLHFGNNSNKVLSNFVLNLNHFVFLLDEDEIINVIKTALQVDDSKTLKYSDTSDNIKYCIKYKSDLLFLSIETKYGLPCVLKITISSNNLYYHETVVNNYVTLEGLKNSLNLVKFICEETKNENNQ